MKMAQRDFSRSTPQSLARLLEPEAGGKTEWSASDLAAILRHQLKAPLRADLSSTNPDAGKTLDTVSAATPAPATFGELFAHPHPPLELLELAKEFGKALRRDPAGGVPAEVATVIYYASIVAARLRCGRQISDLDEATLRRGIQWALARPWLDAAIRALFEAGAG
jgi:hypothetical protein